MPRVPTLDAPTVAPSQGVQNNFQPTLSAEAATLPGRQLQQQGQTLEKAGSAFGDMYLEMAEEANRVRAIEATNRAKQAVLDLTYGKDDGFTGVKGDKAVYREDGQSLPQEWGNKLNDKLIKIRETLTNPQQQMLFDESAATLTTSFKQETQKHFLNEYNAYTKSTYDASVVLDQETLSLSLGDDGKVEGLIKNIEAATARTAQILGQSANEVAMLKKSRVSAAITKGIMSLPDDNYFLSQQLFEKYKDKLSVDDLARVQKQVTAQNDLGIAYEATDMAQAFLYNAPAAPQDPAKPAPKYTGKDLAAAVQKDFGAGYRITSVDRGPRHKLSIANPNSPHTKGMAIDVVAPTPEEGRSPIAFKAAVEKLQALGFNVRAKSINEYVTPSKHATGPHWHFELDNTPGSAPAQTQSGATVVTKQEFRDIALDEAERLAASRGQTITPKQRELIFQKADDRWQNEKDVETEGENKAYEIVQAEIIRNKGDVTKVPTAMFNAMTPADQARALAFGQNIVSGIANANPRRTEILFEFIANPDLLKNMTDNEFRDLQAKLPSSDYLQLAEQRRALQTGNVANNNPEVIDHPLIGRHFDLGLQQAGIDPSPSAKDTKAMARVAGFRDVVNQAVQKRQREIKGQLSNDEAQRIVNGVLGTVYTVAETNFLGQKTGKLITKRVIDLLPKDDVPPTYIARIQKSHIQRHGVAPSDEQIVSQILHDQVFRGVKR
jgi:soluble lytic murein transglycosylase